MKKNKSPQVKSSAKATAKPAAKPMRQAPVKLTASQVLAYLQANPRFLKTHAAKLEEVLPPKKVGNLFSLHAARAGSVESKLAGLKKRYTQLVGLVKGNALAQAQAHKAVLALVAANSPGTLGKALQGPFKAALELHAVRLLHVGPEETATTATRAQIETLCPEAIWLGPVTPAKHAHVFGPATATLKSAAYLKLEHQGAVVGLLALASEDAGHFNAGQDTTLVELVRQVAALKVAG